MPALEKKDSWRAAADWTRKPRAHPDGGTEFPGAGRHRKHEAEPGRAIVKRGYATERP